MEQNFSKSQKIIIAAALVLVAAGVFMSRFAEAGLRDWAADFFTPLFRKEAAAPAPSSTVSLYQPAIDYEKAVVDAVKKASPAVVSITVSKNVPIIEQCPQPLLDFPPEFRDLFGGDVPHYLVPCEKGTKFQEVGGGSGFVIQADGLILTNRHVVSDEKASYTVFTNDGKKYEADIIARDPVQDLAVLKIEANDLPTVTLGDSDSLELGQTAIAIGNALGEFRNTVSVGVISGLARTVTAQGGGASETIHGVIQTDSAINLGNSGGPLLNLRGEVIAINTAIVSGAQNIGFAIPINRAKRDIREVKQTGEIRLPYIGVRYLIVTPEIAEQEKLRYDYGAWVRANEDGPGVMPGSPASAAGIKNKDIILEMNGVKVNKDNPLVELISAREVGETIRVKIARGDDERVLDVTLAERPE